MVVKMKVTGQSEPGLSRVQVFVQIDLLVFNRTPEPLSKDVIQGPAPTIHTDLDFKGFEPLKILGTGKVAPLVTVADKGRGLGQSPIYCRRSWSLFRQALFE